MAPVKSKHRTFHGRFCSSNHPPSGLHAAHMLTAALASLKLDSMECSDISIVRSGRNSKPGSTFTHAEISYFLIVVEAIQPLSLTQWRDVCELYNEEASVKRACKIGNLKRLLQWLCKNLGVGGDKERSDYHGRALKVCREENEIDYIGLLSKEKIRVAAAPYIFASSIFKNRTSLRTGVEACPLDVRERIQTAALAVQEERIGRKRKQRASRNETYRAKKRLRGLADHGRSDNDSEEEDETIGTNIDLSANSSIPERNVDKFLDLPTEDELRDCHRRFRQATSNEALAQAVCASCARLMMQNELTRIDYLDQANRHLLVPEHPHKAHILTNGMLLVSEHLDTSTGRVYGWICSHCLSALKRNRLPAYALSNNMWIGPIPTALSMLTITEQLLIALRYPRGYVIKMHCQRQQGHPATWQSKLRGNVTTYTSNVPDVVKMLEGQLMPRTTTILPSLVAVTFIGRRGALSDPGLKSIFRVRRKVVHAALVELKHKTEHPGYVNLEIDTRALSKLPDDDIPEEILMTTRVESDEGIAERESAGYVPPEPDGSVADNDSEPEDHQREEESEISLQDLPDNNLNEPDVIPLEFSGTSAADGAHITPQELMLSAIENLRRELGEQMTHEGGYAVRHGSFARDFGQRRLGDSGSDTEEDQNPSAWVFPTLFPYGVGGLEAKRAVPVSFAEHSRVCLQHYDRRFRTDHMFAFWSLSIQQKRQALNAAKLMMSRKDFDRTSAVLAELKEEDLWKAAREEETGCSFSDPRVTLLRKMVQVTMQKVMGSDASRALNRSKMWSTSLYLNPVNLWMTLNLVDRHDPICQVFAGEQIDMDNLYRAIGLSSHVRAVNVAKDPYAATQFFFFLANTILETLFGFNLKGRTGQGRMGALGLGSAYFGMVEAQGRGSLHLHMLMWLQNSPNAEEITVKLQSEPFREKIKAYLRANIRSHLENLSDSVLMAMDPTPELAWSRPPDPDLPTYDEDMRTLETNLVRSQQYHVCTPNTCLVYNKKKRGLACKRRAPFDLSPEDVVTETGLIKTKRTIGQLNAWCPAIFYGGRCNNDIKYLTNGAETKGCVWYSTNYATKKQGKSFNGSALITRTYVAHEARSPEILDMRKKNKMFLFRCSLSLNKEMEYSSQQAIAYLMGWGDSIVSHTYTAIYWSPVVRRLKLTYPELTPSTDLAKQHSDENGPLNLEGKQEQPSVRDEMLLRLGVSNNGEIHLRSQLDDYQYRGEALEDTSFLDYYVDTYEERVKSQGEQEDTEPNPSQRGRRRNTRVKYQPQHPRANTAQRVVRSPGHRNLPNIVGPWIERNNNPATYNLHCASVLACVKPWRVMEDLKGEHTSWSNALETYLVTASDRHRSICANVQYYYQCRQSANRSAEQTEYSPDSGDDVVTTLELSELVNGVAVGKMIMSNQKRKELLHAEQAVAIGERFGMFGHASEPSTVPNVCGAITADEASYKSVKEWTDTLKRIADDLRSNNGHKRADADETEDMGSVASIGSENTPATPAIIYEGDTVPNQTATSVDVSMLATDQLRAFNKICTHLAKTYSSLNPPQLFMQIQGEGGTGKSLVISKVTEQFKLLGKESHLRRSAYTGIAASLIEGSTLHQLTLLHLAGKPISKKTAERLREIWGPVQYLIIDEVSMVSKRTLALVSDMIGIGKQRAGENNSTVPFGGLNVILAGDFHQFPPVIGVGKGRGALYTAAAEGGDLKTMRGHEIYEQFTTVVILKKQFRNKDPIWQNILHRSRYGKCTPEDLAIIRSLILDEKRDKELFASNDSPWQSAVLVTPRHAVRDHWNALASRRHCRQTGQKLVQSRAYDTFENKPLDLWLQRLVDARTVSLGDDKGTVKADPGLPDTVELALGMAVLVTYNIETELDVANGARGVIERIIVHPNSEDTKSCNAETVCLARPPACVLVRLQRTRSRALPGLEPGVVPIVPMRSGFQVTVPGGSPLKLYREQLPLTPAYAFTDYRSQGQSIPYVIVDIGKVPSGTLTPFNAYVALSRSVGRETVRLLRDFNPELFTEAPSKELEDEDGRLEDLNVATKQSLGIEV